VLKWLTTAPPRRRLAARREDLAGTALDSDLLTAQIFFVNAKDPMLTRESTDPTAVMAIFGGSPEVQ